MVVSMKGSGLMEKQMDMGGSYTLMAMSTRANERTTGHLARVSTSTLRALITRGIGSTINNRAMGQKPGWMVQNTTDSITRV